MKRKRGMVRPGNIKKDVSLGTWGKQMPREPERKILRGRGVVTWGKKWRSDWGR